jgi:hypothetical protein
MICHLDLPYTNHNSQLGYYMNLEKSNTIQSKIYKKTLMEMFNI